MGFSGRSKSGARVRPNQAGRLHAVAGRFLVYLLTEQARLSAGTPAEREVIKNKGVPWEPSKIAEAIGTSTVQLNHMRERLTTKGLLTSTATGTGNGRRVRFVRLIGRGVVEAQTFQDHGMSAYQWARERDRRAGIQRAEREAELWSW